MMDFIYILAVWAHIFVVAFWVGAMFFSDPESTRFFSRLVEKMGGTGWYAHAVLWSTGFFMLYYRGISIGDLFSAQLVSTPWGKTLWLKILLVLGLVALQVFVGHKPSKRAPYVYVLLAFFVIGLSTVLVRPVIL
jgi:putative copper export protein